MGMPLPWVLHYGPLSVRFFFVLSGYFITLSLWRIKAEMTESSSGYADHLGRFYLGRLFRIGPPFYLALIVGLLFGIKEVGENFLWLATFQANHYVVYLGYWPEAISHFWSLAVQEQFYLFWPLVVLFLPKRWFIPVVIGFLCLGLGFRIFCILTHASTVTRWVTLLGCFDSFAAGALVAYLRQARLLEKVKFLPKTLLFAMPLLAFSCLFLGRALMTLPEESIWICFVETVDAIFLVWLLAVSLSDSQGHLYAGLLGWKPLVYLGRISYGIYVYHVFVIVIVSPVLLSWGLSGDHFALVRLFILMGLTFVLASLSWHFMEKPFLAWKDTFLSRPKQPVFGRLQSTSA